MTDFVSAAIGHNTYYSRHVSVIGRNGTFKSIPLMAAIE
jgi:hypothetical protein